MTFLPLKMEQKMTAQVVDFLKGNEAAALAARQINFHLMGYYPITPSTEIAEDLDETFSRGEHQIRMIPADGEHGDAGICYGAATGGGRVFNATSANGLLYAMEQLPVQSGTRFPMVLNVVTRSISGPLDIRGDHSDIMMALNAGWIILLARNPQAAYDMNLLAVRVGEHPDIRLPVMVAMDGFFTSHQKRRVSYFRDPQVVQEFIGQPRAPVSSLVPANPLTIGAYMNDPDLINNKYQLKLAMDSAECLLPQIFAEYGALRGHPMIVLEYDNQGYMNTGHQLSYATPLGHATATSHVGPRESGKGFHHKDTAQIMAATHVPYVFTGVEGLGTDLVSKGAKAQWYARNRGFVFGKVLSVCPLSWRYDERLGTKIAKAAVDCCFFPVYEVENGKTSINYNPENQGKRLPVSDWLGMMGKSRHLLKPEYAGVLREFEREVERRWKRLKAMHDHPVL
ncbi:MAG: hypothetical protein EHM27_02765 [Deltaproteobacteria bacterium]|nr:MAG: hypothetical protein EHM27_02765 [Deltaproteobacteria bacterium]